METRTLIRVTMIAASFALIVLLFVLMIDVLTLAVRVLTGLTAVAALFGIVALGLVALIAPAVVYSAYGRGMPTRRLLVRFLLVTGIQGFLFALTEGARRALLHTVGPGVADATLGSLNHLIAILGTAGGFLALIAAWAVRRRAR